MRGTVRHTNASMLEYRRNYRFLAGEQDSLDQFMLDKAAVTSRQCTTELWKAAQTINASITDGEWSASAEYSVALLTPTYVLTNFQAAKGLPLQVIFAQIIWDRRVPEATIASWGRTRAKSVYKSSDPALLDYILKLFRSTKQSRPKTISIQDNGPNNEDT